MVAQMRAADIPLEGLKRCDHQYQVPSHYSLHSAVERHRLVPCISGFHDRSCELPSGRSRKVYWRLGEYILDIGPPNPDRSPIQTKNNQYCE